MALGLINIRRTFVIRHRPAALVVHQLWIRFDIYSGIGSRWSALVRLLISSTLVSSVRNLVENFKNIYPFVELPFRLLWNIFLFAAAIALTVAWIGFLFGSVLGVVLILIVLPGGFFIPMALTVFYVELFPISPWYEDWS